MDLPTYKVRIVRPVFQSVIVEVEAGSEEQAVAAALGQADTIPEEEWAGTFEPENYFYDAQCLEEDYDEEDPAFVEDEDGVLDENLDNWCNPDEYCRYLLLKANIFSGDGEVVYQPWLEEVDDLMLADLCNDWSGQLEEARIESFAQAIETMKEQAQAMNKKPAKVYQFKRPSDPDKTK